MFWQGDDRECDFCPYKRKADEYDESQRITNTSYKRKRALTPEEKEIKEMREEIAKMNNTETFGLKTDKRGCCI